MTAKDRRRDYFIGCALQGAMSNPNITIDILRTRGDDFLVLAKACIAAAEAVLGVKDVTNRKR